MFDPNIRILTVIFFILSFYRDSLDLAFLGGTVR
jgi:hypothetical protein